MDYNEFASKIKAKYPQYGDMDNMELAKRMVAKYPQYSDVTFAPPAPPPSGMDETKAVVKNAANVATNALPMGTAVTGDINAVPEPVRRGVLTTGGALLGGSDPLAAGTFAAAGGLVSDAMANPKAAGDALSTAGQAVIDPVGASKRLLALKHEDLQGLAKQAKKTGVDFGEGTVAGVLSNMLGSVATTGPFTGGISDPATALPGAVGKAGKGLQAAKDAAGAFKDYGGIPPARLKAMSELITSSRGSVKLANAAKDALQSGKDMGVTELLIMRQAAGQAEELGGTFAPTYAATKEALTKQLEEKAPVVASKIADFARVAKATGLNESKATLPFLITAINPEVGLAKTATLPWARNLIGAAANIGSRALPTAATAANAAAADSSGQTPFEQFMADLQRKRSQMGQ